MFQHTQDYRLVSPAWCYTSLPRFNLKIEDGCPETGVFQGQHEQAQARTRVSARCHGVGRRSSRGSRRQSCRQ